MERLELTIKGLVQGVGFRYFVLSKSTKLNLVGNVKNTYSGDVEIIAEGKKANLEQLLLKVKEGPKYARVEEVSHEWKPATNEFKSFEIRP